MTVFEIYPPWRPENQATRCPDYPIARNSRDSVPTTRRRTCASARIIIPMDNLPQSIHQRLAGLWVVEANATKMLRIVFCRVEAVEHDALVADDSDGPVNRV